MLETLKKQCKKSYITRLVIALVVIAVVCVWKGSTIVSYIKGPVEIGVGTDLKKLEGKYVTYNAKYLVDEFLRISSKNSKTSKEKLTDIGYIVFDYDNDYFLGILVDAKKEKEMDKLINESWDWMNGTIENVSSFVTVKGTLKNLSGEQLNYFNETASDYIAEESMKTVYTLCITNDKINDTDFIGIWLFTGILGVALLYIILISIRAGSNHFDKKIKEYLTKNTNISLSNIESDFSAAQNVSSNVWIGKKWTIFTEGMYVNIIQNDQLVWAYYYSRTGKNSISRVNAYTLDKVANYINVSKDVADTILEIYQNQQPQMFIGYTKELENGFNKDYEDFLRSKYYADHTWEEREAAATAEMPEREDPFAGI